MNVLDKPLTVRNTIAESFRAEGLTPLSPESLVEKALKTPTHEFKQWLLTQSPMALCHATFLPTKESMTFYSPLASLAIKEQWPPDVYERLVLAQYSQHARSVFHYFNQHIAAPASSDNIDDLAERSELTPDFSLSPNQNRQVATLLLQSLMVDNRAYLNFNLQFFRPFAKQSMLECIKAGQSTGLAGIWPWNSSDLSALPEQHAALFAGAFFDHVRAFSAVDEETSGLSTPLGVHNMAAAIQQKNLGLPAFWGRFFCEPAYEPVLRWGLHKKDTIAEDINLKTDALVQSKYAEPKHILSFSRQDVKILSEFHKQYESFERGINRNLRDHLLQNGYIPNPGILDWCNRLGLIRTLNNPAKHHAYGLHSLDSFITTKSRPHEYAARLTAFMTWQYAMRDLGFDTLPDHNWETRDGRHLVSQSLDYEMLIEILEADKNKLKNSPELLAKLHLVKALLKDPDLGTSYFDHLQKNPINLIELPWGYNFLTLWPKDKQQKWLQWVDKDGRSLAYYSTNLITYLDAPFNKDKLAEFIRNFSFQLDLWSKYPHQLFAPDQSGLCLFDHWKAASLVAKERAAIGLTFISLDTTTRANILLNRYLSQQSKNLPKPNLSSSSQIAPQPQTTSKRPRI